MNRYKDWVQTAFKQNLKKQIERALADASDAVWVKYTEWRHMEKQTRAKTSFRSKINFVCYDIISLESLTDNEKIS